MTITASPGRSFSRPFRRVLQKVCVVAMPIFVVVGIDVFLLPVDYFTFRLWEALWTTQECGTRYLLPGPFYPGMTIAKIETFDLASNSSDSVRTLVRWETDRFGYRKRHVDGRIYPILIVGDSSTVGTGLDQPDTLSEVLEGMLGAGVYPYAVSRMGSFLRDVRFIDAPPKVVVLAVTERMIPSLEEVPMTLATMSEREKSLRRLLLRVQQAEWVPRIGTSIDRALKLAPLHYARARLARDATARIKSPTHPQILFLQGAAAFQPVRAAVLARCVRTIKSIKAVLGERGIQFVFLPVPNKETIYYRRLGAANQPVFLADLARALHAEGIDSVDTRAGFSEAHAARGAELYQTEDSHWNPSGVRLAARLLAHAIQEADKDLGVVGPSGAAPHACRDSRSGRIRGAPSASTRDLPGVSGR